MYNRDSCLSKALLFIASIIYFFKTGEFCEFFQFMSFALKRCGGSLEKHLLQFSFAFTFKGKKRLLKCYQNVLYLELAPKMYQMYLINLDESIIR